MAEDDSQEKTEEPTQRKIEKALEDGQVLNSKEVFVFTTLLVGLGLVFAIGSMLPLFLGVWRGFFQFGAPEVLAVQINARMGEALRDFLILALSIAVPLMLVAFATQAAVGGVHFVSKNIMFKGNRINPLSGLKRIFSVRGLVELGKALLKVFAIGGAALLVISQRVDEVLPLVRANLDWAMHTVATDFKLLVVATLMVLALIAALDYLYARHSHFQKLRMSKQEMKDQNKETEGSPEVKSRIRRLQMEASRRASEAASALDNVGEATAIITNPTHFAVALRYVPGDTGAPMIIAMGRGRLAEQIIEKAEEAGITVWRCPLLARALFFTGDIGQEISEKLYSAVATALAYIYRIDRGEDVPEPEVDLPEDVQFTEDGRMMNEAEGA